MDQLLLEYCRSTTLCVFGALFTGLLLGYVIGSKWWIGEPIVRKKRKTVPCDKVQFIEIDDLRRDKCRD